MNVLDLLKYRLSSQDRNLDDLDPVARDMIQGGMGRRLQPGVPPGLPLVVQDSIGKRRSYGEGEIMAPEEFWNPALGGQLQMSGPQRENYLLFDRGEALGIPQPDAPDPRKQIMPEGGVWSSRPPGMSPFADPINQLLTRLGQRAPLALY